MADGQMKKRPSHEAAPLATATAPMPQIKIPDVGAVLKSASKEVEKAKKEMEDNQKRKRIIALINQNMQQMAKGEEPVGSCTC